MRDINGQLGQPLRSNDFLNSIVQRSSIAGGAFDFDLPQYHYWLQMPQQERALQLDDWRHEVTPVQDAVELLLNLIRAEKLSAIGSPYIVPSLERTCISIAAYGRSSERSLPAQPSHPTPKQAQSHPSAFRSHDTSRARWPS